MRKILILAANPKDLTRLQLGEEVREIREGLKRARHRDEFNLVERWAVRPRDLQRALLDEMPQIVHFSGHGIGKIPTGHSSSIDRKITIVDSNQTIKEGLFLEDHTGNPKLVGIDSLEALFSLFSKSVECVVLNACYSEPQAQVLARHIPYVIGMKESIGDQAAIEFSIGFYDALGRGNSIEFAFDSGKVAMQLNSTGSSEMPVLWKGTTQNEIASETKLGNLTPKKQSTISFKKPTSRNIPSSIDLTLDEEECISEIETPEVQEEYKYDAYITYVDHQPDSTWVWSKLIPRLKEAHLHIAVSGELENLGVAQVVNIERGIRQSKRTLIVLSESYLNSSMATFENILGQTMGIQEGTYRVLPVQFGSIGDTMLPTRLSMLSTLNLSHSSRVDERFKRLIKALQGPLPRI